MSEARAEQRAGEHTARVAGVEGGWVQVRAGGGEKGLVCFSPPVEDPPLIYTLKGVTST